MTQPPRLWNPDRRGTLIVGDPRFGTHYLQSIVRDHVSATRPYDQNGEIDLAPIVNWPRFVRDKLQEMESRESYQIAIVNSVVAKTELIAHPEMLDRWHVIRLTRKDKISWFRSWALFFMHEHSEHNSGRASLLHHGTPQDAYVQSLADHGPVLLDAQNINQVGGNLGLQVLSFLVSADEEIDFDDLPGLQTQHTWWKGNHYPDMGMDEMFSNYQEVEALLRLWDGLNLAGSFRR